LNYSPTAGCAALSKDDLLAFLALARPDTRLCFRGVD
jgi:L,D-peptidoglycan transpeptidase YkuD (ErfK/YbiS/YcfS/YnhG family)